MAEQFIFECPTVFPTLKRAKEIAPPEFAPCYDWYLEKTDAFIPVLPHRLKVKPDAPVALSRDSGIHSPSKKRVVYPLGHQYALSVHSNIRGKYSDKSPIRLADGTWILDYAAHEGEAKGQNYNECLLDCLRDGLPVGVLVKEGDRGGYHVLGLAYVERYNAATRMFTLHGPVTPETEAAGAFATPGFDELPAQEQSFLVEFDTSDDRRITTVRQVRREQQGKFRDELMAAYESTCAITGTSVPQVLQAAHINPYRGKRSQVVNNGLLLRADLHLLFDAHLISVEPDSLVLRLSERLADTDYLRYNHRRVRKTIQPEMAPDRSLLDMHYRQFKQENPHLVG